ncbi:FAD dependent oxidoreductase, putative [Synechococcus sp. PCC 7335]|uniref:phytoene desaturase family protein n=1 Tax=Synechococcus sp. (strain ATCC 29403 / PCC 7335) TaxID=91464 RepID=UPI00017EDFD5|nr:NAD(P)/FAD-dependent oxidoreductase [Synechococcus sp. PCC 7335]EDX85029.1 FAD dependent oxidoreductase, putative [Synechococcus sp. PCC 7335]
MTQSVTTRPKSPIEKTVDAVVIGSGLGGLVAGSLLARYGRRVIVFESHTLPGGAAHAFTRRHRGDTFTFDSGPSFYSGLGESGSANPLTQVLAVLGERLETIPYEPFGYYHLPEGTLPVYGNSQKYQQAIEQFSPGAAAQMAALEARLLKIYAPLKEMPSLALRADLWALPLLAKRYGRSLAALLPNLLDLSRSMGEVMAPYVSDPWLKRLLDLECFLLSGMKCEDTVAPEMAFMFGERASSVIDYPVGGSGAIVEALVRGLRRWGGQLRLGAHVQKIVVDNGKAKGVVLKNGEQINAPMVISNATRWDTYSHLLDPTELGANYRQAALSTPAVDSFMHLHLGIRADGLESVPIHHVVVHDNQKDITVPGNTCMVSIPTVLDPQQAPAGYHTVHAYTLEPFAGWQKDEHYEQKKREKAETLFRAVERIIPDLRDRIELELIGTPLTHSRFLRRHKGTYGPAISAQAGRFPSGKTPIEGLHLVGDSTLPGIGVPAVAASGILCANSLVTPKESAALLTQL